MLIWIQKEMSDLNSSSHLYYTYFFPCIYVYFLVFNDDASERSEYSWQRRTLKEITEWRNNDKKKLLKHLIRSYLTQGRARGDEESAREIIYPDQHEAASGCPRRGWTTRLWEKQKTKQRQHHNEISFHWMVWRNKDKFY